VFYLEAEHDGRKLRAKYAVISLEQFRRGTSSRTFQSTLWARYCQPCRIVYARDDGVRRVACLALSGAVVTMVRRSVLLLAASFTAADLWVRAFTETYRAELRAERAGRARMLHDADADRYVRLTPLALEAAALDHDFAAPDRFTLRRAIAGPRRRSATL